MLPLLLLRALLLLLPLVLQLSTVIIFALPSRKRLATFTDAPPSPISLFSPFPSSYSFLSHSQKKRTKYCRSQISFESASKLPLVALYWMAVVAFCRHRALRHPPFPSPSSLPQLETVVYILLGQNSRLKFFN